ncbi:hypothetical protein DLM45_14040 [Hyphomicrobium methylovorum]|nr:hypothetical protein [Hyphomicrobium methylovorum]
MLPYFSTLLARATAIREAIEREERLGALDSVKLMRLKNLHLRLSARMRDLIAMASAPRLRSNFLYARANSTPAIPHRW